MMPPPGSLRRSPRGLYARRRAGGGIYHHVTAACQEHSGTRPEPETAFRAGPPGPWTGQAAAGRPGHWITLRVRSRCNGSEVKVFNIRQVMEMGFISHAHSPLRPAIEEADGAAWGAGDRQPRRLINHNCTGCRFG